MGKILHASGSGYFPFCIGSGGNFGPYEGANSGGVYPVGMSLSDAMNLYWRVKKWRVVFPGGHTGDITSQYYFNQQQPPREIQDEAEIVCSEGLFLYYSFPQQPLGDAYVFQLVIADKLPNVAPAEYKIKSKDSLYWPRMIILGLYIPYDVTLPYTSYWAVTVDYILNNQYIQGSSLKLFNYDIPLVAPESLSPEVFQEQPMTVSLNAAEWWSYDGTFNTKTGARL